MKAAAMWARSQHRRYIALAFNYITERGVLLGALLIPALVGVSDADLGTLELLLTSAALAAAIGPMGTQHALLYEEFRGSAAAWRSSVATALIGGSLVGILGAVTLGPVLSLLGGLLGAGAAVHRVGAYQLRADDDTRPLTSSSWLFALAFGAGSALVALSGDWATMMPWILIGALIVAAVPAFLRVRRAGTGDPARYSSMLRYGIPLSFAQMAEWIVVAGDRYVLQYFLGLEAVGPYGVIYRTAMLLSGAVSTVVIWWQAEAMRRGFSWARTRLRYYLVVTASGTAVMAVLGLIPASFVLAGITGLPRSEVTATVAWLFVSIVGFVVLMGYVHVFASAGWVRLVGWLSIANAAVNILSNLVLVPSMGVKGAAAATAISQCLTAVVAAEAYRRRMRTYAA